MLVVFEKCPLLNFKLFSIATPLKSLLIMELFYIGAQWDFTNDLAKISSFDNVLSFR